MHASSGLAGRYSASRVVRGRIGVMVQFLAAGMWISGWLSRLPSVRDGLGVSNATLATVIAVGAVGAVGSLAMVTVAGWITQRIGAGRTIWAGSIIFTLGTLGIAASLELSSLAVLAVSQVAVSAGLALANVAMNAEAATVERHVGATLMPQFHAGFSVGLALGLLVGAAASHAGIPASAHLAISALVVTAVRLWFVRWAVLDPAPSGVASGLGGSFGTARHEYRDRYVLLLGAIAFAGAAVEMSASQWIAISMVDSFAVPEATGDLVYWLFVVAMVTVRLAGAPIIARLRRSRSLAAAGGASALGLVGFALLPWLWAMPVAAVLWGIGAALVVPLVTSAAADDPRRAAATVAAVTSFATIAQLLVPQAIGALTHLVDLRLALLALAAASIVIVVLAGRVHRLPAATSVEEPDDAGLARAGSAS